MSRLAASSFFSWAAAYAAAPGLAVCVKGAYVFVAKWPVGTSAQAGQLAAIDAIAIGFYWACGEIPSTLLCWCGAANLRVRECLFVARNMSPCPSAPLVTGPDTAE